MTNAAAHPKCQRLAATIIEEELELAATIVEDELELVAPFLPINRQREREQSLSEREQSKERRRETSIDVRLDNHSGPSMLDTFEGECCVS